MFDVGLGEQITARRIGTVISLIIFGRHHCRGASRNRSVLFVWDVPVRSAAAVIVGVLVMVT